MTKRSVPEWIGKTPDTAVPPRVRDRVFQAHEGMCHLTGRKITAADRWELDHILALANGGENRESNLAPALSKAHKAKTVDDVRQKAKNDRIRKKHIGIKKPSSFATARGGKWKKKIDGTTILRGTRHD